MVFLLIEYVVCIKYFKFWTFFLDDSFMARSNRFIHEAWQRILMLLQLGVAEHERQCRDPVEICWVLLWLLGFSTTIA